MGIKKRRNVAEASFHVPDGLSEIKNELPLIMKMIARTARWVHPETFKALPIWCPDTARGFLRYDARWSRVLENSRGVQKKEENIRAAMALVEALGLLSQSRKIGPFVTSGATTTRSLQGTVTWSRTRATTPASET